MPTKREREYYRMGFRDGYTYHGRGFPDEPFEGIKPSMRETSKDPYLQALGYEGVGGLYKAPKPKRKLSAWNKFVKANSKKSEFRYRDGKLNLKKMGVAFRRKKRR